MTGSRKWFEYTADDGSTYCVEMDESNGEAVGNADYTDTSTAVNCLPRNIEPRKATYTSSDGNTRRGIIITDNAANATTIPQQINVNDTQGNVIQLNLTLFVGELFKRIPTAIDTGLIDGDDT